MLWVDKYRPTSLKKMEVHQGLSERLLNIVKGEDLPHLLFYGPSGSGKKTRIMSVLREIYGSSVEKLKMTNKSFKISETSSTEVNITTLSSNHHIEVTPSDAGVHDRVIVANLIRDIAKSVPIDTKGPKAFKTIIINDVDQLSREAQQALRRTMEKYTRTCRLILCATSACRVIDPIKSRCLNMRVPAPAVDEIKVVLQDVVKKERIKLPESFCDKIANSCDRNLRRALLMFEASKVERYPFQPDQKVRCADWELYIKEIAKDIMEEQNTERILVVRNKLYELLANCIPPDIILQRLCDELISKTDSALKYDVVNLALNYEHRIKTGSKPIFHLEAFVAKFMSLFKNFILSYL